MAELAYKRKARLRGKNRKVRFSMVYDMNNIRVGEKEARKGKASPKNYHKGVRIFDSRPDEFIKEIHDALEARTYHTSKPTVCDQLCPCGKVRRLTKLPYYPDHIVHHALMNVSYPIMKRFYYYDSYASISGKGMHFASKRVKRYISEHAKAGRLYWIKRDFVKFYHNINQQKAFDCVCDLFGDSGIRYLFHEAVTVCEQGLGIGLFPIQPIANLYTCGVCREVMRRFEVRIFVYCDDILLIGEDKKEVWKASNFLEEYADKVMEQPLHEEVGMQVIDDEDFCDFVGYRFYMNRTHLRKRMKGTFMCRMHNIKDPMIRYQVATSYKGWLMYCDGFSFWCRVMGMKSFKELMVPKFEEVDGEGKRMLKGTRCSASIFVGREIIFRDAEIGVRSKFSKNGREKKSTLIQVEEHGQLFKFFTDNQKLIKTMEYVKNQNGFPFKGTLVNTNKTGGLPDYEIE